MGAPKKVVFRKEPRVPTVSEKIIFLNTGKKIGKNYDLERLPEIIEELRIFILPLVEWLDNPLPHYDADYWKCLREKRGIFLFELNNIRVFLQRSGKWIVRRIYDQEPSVRYRCMSSDVLASVLSAQKDNLIKLPRIDITEIIDEIPNKLFSDIVKDMAIYAAILNLVKQCLENVSKLIREKEERIRIIKERVELLRDFHGSLDPLSATGNTVRISEYSIWEETKRGTCRSTLDYLCPEALIPFWDLLKERRAVIKGKNEKEGYYEQKGEWSCSSIENFLSRLEHYARGIKTAREHSRMDASTFEFNSGRMPFSKEEISVIFKLIGFINKISKE